MLTILSIIVICFIARIYYVKNKLKSQHLKKIEFEKEIRQHCYKLGLSSDQVTSITFDSTVMSQIDSQSIRYTSQGGKWFGRTRANAVAMLIKEHYEVLHTKSVCVKLLKWASEFNLQQFSPLIHELEHKINLHTIRPIDIKSIFALTEIETDLWEVPALGKQLFLPEEIKSLPNLTKISYGSINPSYKFDVPIRNDFELLDKCKNIKKFGIYNLPSFNPSWIFDLKHIEFLEFNENGYESIPLNVFDLPNLCELHICEYNITAIPDSISKCKKLTTLAFYSTKLQEISEEILKLDNLIYFEGSLVDELKNSETVLKLRDSILARGGEFKVWLGTHS